MFQEATTLDSRHAFGCVVLFCGRVDPGRKLAGLAWAKRRRDQHRKRHPDQVEQHGKYRLENRRSRRRPLIPNRLGRQGFPHQQPYRKEQTHPALHRPAQRPNSLATRCCAVSTRNDSSAQQPRLRHSGHRRQTSLRHVHARRGRQGNRAECRLRAPHHSR